MTNMLDIGKKAPAFSFDTSEGAKMALKDLKDQKIVLYFYPKDDTPGCTKEAIAFSADLPKFKRANTVVIGVSRDPLTKHQKFKDKHDLTIILGSDENGTVTEKYGVWVEKKNYGRTYMGIERSTFLIDEKGVIRQIWRKVRVAGHVEDVLNAAIAL